MEDPASPARSVKQTVALDELRLTIHLNGEADEGRRRKEMRSENKINGLIDIQKKPSQSRTLVWRLLLA